MISPLTEEARLKKSKPTHYKVISISMYTIDLTALDDKVAECKRRGWTKATRSELIRIALAKLEVDHVTFPGRREDVPA